jgi:acyl-CoA synthetase (AMP-forming)/AMP-acid ligase II
MKNFALDKYILYHDIYRITFMNAVPTMLVMLSKSAAALNYNFRSIEQVVVGSAPLSKDIAELVQKRLLKPGVKVKQGWGMTELTCTGTSFAPDDEDDGASIGPLNANMSAKIMPVDDRDFGNATKGGRVIGEIWVSGPNMMRGYYNKPKETAETIVVENGKRWLRTGDIGYFDERECLYIVDRLKVDLLIPVTASKS